MYLTGFFGLFNFYDHLKIVIFSFCIKSSDWIIDIFMTLIKKIKDKKVNFEFNKEYIKVVTDKISSNDALFISNSFKEMHPADAADIIEHLSQNDRENLIKLNNFKIDPEVFVEPQ